MQTTERHFTDAGIVYYGPHACAECGEMIVKAGREFGGAEFDYPSPAAYPNHVWTPHVHRVAQSTSQETSSAAPSVYDETPVILDFDSTPSTDTSTPDSSFDGFDGGSSGGGGADGSF